jgi:hypothetical protein
MSYEDYLISKPQEHPDITEALCYLTGISHPIKGSSTKCGKDLKAIKARRKKNKNKKTHRK